MWGRGGAEGAEHTLTATQLNPRTCPNLQSLPLQANAPDYMIGSMQNPAACKHMLRRLISGCMRTLGRAHSWQVLSMSASKLGIMMKKLLMVPPYTVEAQKEC